MENKTILVSGTFRGGTTATINIIKALGVPIGDRHGVTLEDRVIRSLFHTKTIIDEQSLSRLAGLYSAEYGTFAFKYPALHRSEQSVEACIRCFNNPYFVFVTRDPLAVVRSEARHTDGVKDKDKVFERTLSDYARILFTWQNYPQAKIKLVSFEYLTNPKRNVEEIRSLAEALDITTDAETIKKIASALVLPDIEPGVVPTNYPVF